MSLKVSLVASIAAFLVLGGGFLLANADVSHLKFNEPAAPPGSPPVTEVCLGCICEGISGCNRTLTCNGDVCGLFRITWAYWADAGKPTLNGAAPDSQNAYSDCVIDPYCAARAVQGYMTKFGQDCDGNGVIDCHDHAAIHKLGGYGCTGDVTEAYHNRVVACLDEVAKRQGFQG